MSINILGSDGTLTRYDGTITDNKLDQNSTNPIQNKIITYEIDAIKRRLEVLEAANTILEEV